MIQATKSVKAILRVCFASDLFISHFLFVDDIFLFRRSSLEDCGRLKNILDCYSVALGQVFDHDKSSIHFIHNMAPNVLLEITSFFGIC